MAERRAAERRQGRGHPAGERLGHGARSWTGWPSASASTSPRRPHDTRTEFPPVSPAGRGGRGGRARGRSSTVLAGHFATQEAQARGHGLPPHPRGLARQGRAPGRDRSPPAPRARESPASSRRWTRRATSSCGVEGTRGPDPRGRRLLLSRAGTPDAPRHRLRQHQHRLRALGRDAVPRGTWRIATDWRRTADEYFVWLCTLIMRLHRRRGRRSTRSSSPPRCRAWCSTCASCRDRYFGTPPARRGQARLPPAAPSRGWTRARRSGPDRLVNTAGAFDRHGGNLIVVDFGTATTFDVVDDDGAYVGGVIAPGVNLSLEALHMAAAALPHVDVTKPQRVIGTNTVACMQSGIFWGYVGLVRGHLRPHPGRARPRRCASSEPAASPRCSGKGDVLFDRHRGRPHHARPDRDPPLQQGDGMTVQ